MSHKRPRSWGNPDLRHQTQVPAPPIAQIEQQLFSLLTPGSFQPLRLAQGEKKRRDRLLTLPVMMAIVVSLVYRQIPGLSENYLTNVLDPQILSAQQVCELYRRRWRVEDAFLLTKRLLGLAYLWVGGTNGVQIQIFATWIFYAVLNDLCSQVAVALNQPKERISVEMVFRGLYHFARALMRSESTDVVTYLVEHHQLLSLVKAERKRHRENAAHSSQIWAGSG